MVHLLVCITCHCVKPKVPQQADVLLVSLHSTVQVILAIMYLQDHWGKLIGLFCVFWALLLWPPLLHQSSPEVSSKPQPKLKDWCPLPDIPTSAQDGLQPSRLLLKPDALKTQLKRLSAAVNVATVSYDDNGDVDKDPRWEIFEEFHVRLERDFPLV